MLNYSIRKRVFGRVSSLLRQLLLCTCSTERHGTKDEFRSSFGCVTSAVRGCRAEVITQGGARWAFWASVTQQSTRRLFRGWRSHWEFGYKRSIATSLTSSSQKSQPAPQILHSKMRFSRFMFILVVVVIGAISSVVMAMDERQRPSVKIWSPLTKEVKKALARLELHVKQHVKSIDDGLTHQMAGLQLDPRKDTVPPVQNPDQASTSHMEIDGKDKQDTAETADFNQRQKAVVAWLEELLSLVDEYQRKLASEEVRALVAVREADRDYRNQHPLDRPPWVRPPSKHPPWVRTPSDHSPSDHPPWDRAPEGRHSWDRNSWTRPSVHRDRSSRGRRHGHSHRRQAHRVLLLTRSKKRKIENEKKRIEDILTSIRTGVPIDTRRPKEGRERDRDEDAEGSNKRVKL